MIISEINGGLGNQMFQYAAARALAIRLGLPLALDTSVFQTYKVHSYALDKLYIQEQITSPAELSACRARARKRWQLPFWNLISSPKVYREPHFHYDPSFKSIRGSHYIEGYFQSERYFAEISDVIRKEFTPREELSGKNLELSRQMQNRTSVSLHVRRGDYLNNPQALEFHGLAPLDYYAEALRRLQSQLGSFDLYVFSDDPEWTQQNIHSEQPMTFITHNQNRNTEDLRLMSHCKHHIIANSTFSWWGAWLNERSDKIVFAPRHWFTGAQHDTKDLFPPSWNLL